MVKVNSVKPVKQRNALRKVKNHQISKLFTVPLSEALQEEYGVKRMPVRKDDFVRIVSGNFTDIEGKVLSVNKKTRKLTIEEATLQKRDGSNYYMPVSVSNVILTKFGGKKMDPWRVNRMMERKQKLELAEPTSPKKGKGGKK